MRPRHTLLAATLLLMSASAARAQRYTFESLRLNDHVPFSLTSAGVTATFEGPDETFVVGSSFFNTLSRNILLDSDEAFNELTITFSQPLTNVSLVFALNSGSEADQLTLAAFLGGVAVGSASANGTIVDFGFPEGVLAFAGGAFDRIVLSSDAPDFAIDNVQGPTNVIPEPATALLVGVGVVAVAVVRRRRVRLS